MSQLSHRFPDEPERWGTPPPADAFRRGRESITKIAPIQIHVALDYANGLRGVEDCFADRAAVALADDHARLLKVLTQLELTLTNTWDPPLSDTGQCSHRAFALETIREALR